MTLLPKNLIPRLALEAPKDALRLPSTWRQQQRPTNGRSCVTPSRSSELGKNQHPKPPSVSGETKGGLEISSLLIRNCISLGQAVFSPPGRVSCHPTAAVVQGCPWAAECLQARATVTSKNPSALTQPGGGRACRDFLLPGLPGSHSGIMPTPRGDALWVP